MGDDSVGANEIEYIVHIWKKKKIFVYVCISIQMKSRNDMWHDFEKVFMNCLRGDIPYGFLFRSQPKNCHMVTLL